MRLPAYAIKNYQFTIMAFGLLLLMGLTSFLTMPRSEDPYVEPPFANVIVVAPGTSAIDMETGVADILEDRFNGIEAVKHIDTTIEDGLLLSSIKFEADADMDELEAQLKREVMAASADFPPGVVDWEAYTFSILYVKVLQIAVGGTGYELRELWNYADVIKDELQKVHGVTNVEVVGYPGEEVAVTLHPERLSQYGVPITAVFQVLQTNSSNIPGGEVRIGERRFNLRTSGKYQSLKQLGGTVIGANDGGVVYLRDVADIGYRYSRPRFKIFHGGGPALLVTLEQQKGENLLKINDQMKQRLEDLESRLPPDLSVKVVFEQAQSVRQQVNAFFGNLMQGILLVGIVVLLLIGARPSIVIMLAIPTSLIMSIGFIDLSGFGLQQMTITALIISLGLLVDNAIVITENIQRFLNDGHPRLKAAQLGAAEVGWPVVSATATTVLAFVPLMLMKDMTGDYMRSLSVGIAITLICSLVVAVTLSPMISYHALTPIREAKVRRAKRLFDRIVTQRYRPLLAKALRHRKTVLLLACGVFTCALLLFPLVGISYFPMAEKPQLLVNVHLPRGASLERTESVVLGLARSLKEKPEIVDMVSNVGKGNPPVYYNMGAAPEKNHFGQILLQLDPGLSLQEMNELAQELRHQFAAVPGARVEVKQFRQGPGGGAPIEVRVIGDNQRVLKKLGAQVKTIVENTPGCINVQNPLELDAIDLKLNIDRDKAALLGVSLIDIDRIVRLAVSGVPVGSYQDDAGDLYDIVLRLPETEDERFADFDLISLPSRHGEIPLAQVAHVAFTPGYNVVQHYDLDRAVTITADIMGREVEPVNREIQAKLKEINLPTGYRFLLGGIEEQRGESFNSLARATLIAVIGIYGILVLQFRSFLQPFIIYATIPLAVVGSVLALLVTGFSFSVSAFIGFASLIGIVINNAIILVDYTNRLIAQGMDKTEALLTAGSVRFRPIIATTLTTIGGLLPLTLLGSSLWAPLGLVIMGGLSMSTALTLLVVPVLYHILVKEPDAASGRHPPTDGSCR